MQKLNLHVVLFSDILMSFLPYPQILSLVFYNIVHSLHFTASPQSTNSILHDCTEVGLWIYGNGCYAVKIASIFISYLNSFLQWNNSSFDKSTSELTGLIINIIINIIMDSLVQFVIVNLLFDNCELVGSVEN